MKGKVSSQELKEQFAEHVPGALQIFADALGISTEEMYKQMDAGKLLAKDVLPKVGKAMSAAARKGGALDKQLESLAAQEGILATQFQLLKEDLGEAGFAKMAITAMKTLSEVIKNQTPTLKIFAASLNLAFSLVTLPFRAITAFVMDINRLLPESTPNWVRAILGVAGAFAAWRFGVLGVISVISTGLIPLLGTLVRTLFTVATASAAAMAPLLLAAAPYLLGAAAVAGAGYLGYQAYQTVAQPQPSPSATIMKQGHVRNNRATQNVNVEVDLKSDMLDAKIHKTFSDAVSPNTQD